MLKDLRFFSWHIQVLFLVLILTLGVGVAVINPRSHSEQVLWRDDNYDTARGSWTRIDSARDEALTVSEKWILPPLDGSRLATVEPGDHTNSRRTERAELALRSADIGGYEGQTIRYQWSTLFPTIPSLAPNGWLIFTQFHHTGGADCSPNVAFRLTESDDGGVVMSLETRGGSIEGDRCLTRNRNNQIAKLEAKKWYNFDLLVDWSSSDTASVHLRLDGKPVFDSIGVANMYKDRAVYLKQGIYRSLSPLPASVVTAGLRVTYPGT